MYLYSRRVDVLLGVDHSEKHLHKAFGLILKKHIHLADHGLLELVHRLVFLDQGQDVLGQSCRVCIAAKREIRLVSIKHEKGKFSSYSGSRWEVSQLLSSSCFSISILLLLCSCFDRKMPFSGCSERLRILMQRTDHDPSLLYMNKFHLYSAL